MTQKTMKRARQVKREKKSPTTQAGAFVHEEVGQIRKGIMRGARSAKQAIAAGVSKARRAGAPIKPPKKGTVSEKTRKKAEADYEKGQGHVPVSRTRSTTRAKALKKEPHATASHVAHAAVKSHAPAMKSGMTKSIAVPKEAKKRSAAAKKAAVTRARKKKPGSFLRSLFPQI